MQVNPLPSVTVTPSPGSICPGDFLQLNAGGSALSYSWNAASTLNTTLGPVVIATPLVTTTYLVTGTDVNYCTKQAPVIVVVNPLPKPDLGPDKSICTGSVSIISPGNFSKYLWQDNSTQSNLTVNNIGTYWVNVENSFGCKGADTVRIISFFTSPENFLPGNTSFCKGSQQVIVVPGYAQYLWYDGSILPEIAIREFGQYTLTVKDYNGCYGTDSITLSDAKCIRYAIPNAFTPNQDGKNDVFRPFITQNVTDYKMMIWSRWGQIVFNTNQPQKGWDGLYNGSLQPAGTYIYIIHFTDSDGLPVDLKGTFNLIR
jgi:gliding motility-associated-like protein